jgi:hypothetical protein
MMTEDELKREMRLIAVEALAVNLLTASILLQPSDPEQTMANIRQWMLRTASLPFPELEPAESDLYASEFEAAVDRLMEMADSQIRLALQGLRARAGHGSSDGAPSNSTGPTSDK